jgi:hypothetical protein
VLASTVDEWVRQSSFFGGIALTVCLVAVLVLRQLELLDAALDRHPPPRSTERRFRRLVARRRGVARTATVLAAPLLCMFVVLVLARFVILT